MADLHIRVGAIITVAVALLTSCQRSPQARPVIQFTRLPHTGPPGPDTVDLIAGRVSGAQPGERIVVYAKGGIWWVQPQALQPIIPIDSDGVWRTQTHLGSEYAVLLVEQGYRPALTLDSLPKVGGPVRLISIARGSPEPPLKTLTFSGYDWEIRELASQRGGDWNAYSPQNAWIDADSHLHLAITISPRGWQCAEVNLKRALGYGTYQIHVRDVSQLEPAAVFSMFTWDIHEAGQNHREMDVEVSRWGDPVSKNAQYVVQPYYMPANVLRFVMPKGPVRLSMKWQPERVLFETSQLDGQTRGPRSIPSYEFTSGVPQPSGETLHLNLYWYGRIGVKPGKPSEIVVDKFEYLP